MWSQRAAPASLAPGLVFVYPVNLELPVGLQATCVAVRILCVSQIKKGQGCLFLQWLALWAGQLLLETFNLPLVVPSTLWQANPAHPNRGIASFKLLQPQHPLKPLSDSSISSNSLSPVTLCSICSFMRSPDPCWSPLKVFHCLTCLTNQISLMLSDSVTGKKRFVLFLFSALKDDGGGVADAALQF